MKDGETFRWPVVRMYHVVWLQHLEQGRATWNDEATRLKLLRAFVWHRTATSYQTSATPTTTTSQPPTQASRHTGPFRLTAQPVNRACIAYNQGLCTNNAAHRTDIHVCSFCLQVSHRLCQHSELNCKCKILTNGPEGPQAIDPPPHLG